MIVLDDFLTPEQIGQLLQEIVVQEPSHVYSDKNQDGNINQNTRKSFHCVIPDKWDQEIKAALQALIPKITDKFKPDSALDLNTLETLYYDTGHFFKPHSDSNPNVDRAKDRKVTAVLYLSDSIKYDPNGFEGGEFILYGLNPKFPNSGFPILAKKGRLLLFPSHLIHEVKPITKGDRYCVVAWYC